MKLTLSTCTPKNVQSAIAIMNRAATRNSVNMTAWQSWGTPRGEAATTEGEFHTCGNAACFAGHVAISPEFHACGGQAEEGWGTPTLNDYYGSSAIAEWLGIAESLVDKLVHGDLDPDNYDSLFYGKPWDEVNAQDVIDKLELVLAGELS